MHKRGAVAVDVGDVSIRFPGPSILNSSAERPTFTVTGISRDEGLGCETDEEHLKPSDDEMVSVDPGPMASALETPLQADVEQADASDEATFETWYQSTPKPSSFAR